MAPKKVASSCKFCKKVFGESPNPLVKDAAPGDTLARRCPGSKDCRACYSFIKTVPAYLEMTSTALEKHLEDAGNQAAYDTKWKEYCESRQSGKRTRSQGHSKCC